MFRNLVAIASGGLAAVSLIVAAPVAAHHSYSAFDRSKTITLQGTIAEMEWTNPHTYVVLLVKAKGGAQARWTIEGNPPAGMARDGWKKSGAKVGDVITIVINPLRVGGNGGHYVSAILPGNVKVGPPAG
jgi:hypothetical protein